MCWSRIFGCFEIRRRWRIREGNRRITKVVLAIPKQFKSALAAPKKIQTVLAVSEQLKVVLDVSGLFKMAFGKNEGRT